MSFADLPPDLALKKVDKIFYSPGYARGPLLMNNTIYFLHIPKSGGISATRYFEEAVPSEAVCPHKLWDDLVKSGLDPRWRVYHGHFGGLFRFG